jgi:hypothetical protein
VVRDDSASFEAMTTDELKRMRAGLNVTLALAAPGSAVAVPAGRQLRNIAAALAAKGALMTNPFSVDVDRAIDALAAEWEPAGYEEIEFWEGRGWYAYHKDGGEDLGVLEADTPDELAAKIRADWQRRQGGEGAQR